MKAPRWDQPTHRQAEWQHRTCTLQEQQSPSSSLSRSSLSWCPPVTGISLSRPAHSQSPLSVWSKVQPLSTGDSWCLAPWCSSASWQEGSWRRNWWVCCSHLSWWWCSRSSWGHSASRLQSRCSVTLHTPHSGVTRSQECRFCLRSIGCPKVGMEVLLGLL